MNVSFKKKNIKDVHDLELKLFKLLCKKFNFYTQLRLGQLKQTHLLREMRREIARIKFYLSKSY